MDNWCTIESDPAIFTELIESWGVKHVEVEEVFSLDEVPVPNALHPIYGFIFLFKWTNTPKIAPALTSYDPQLYFAKQVITNACATQALLSILLNNEDKINLSNELSELRSFGLQLDSYSRGLTIGQCQKIRETHNSFAPPEPFVKMGSKKATPKDDVFHFVAFIQKNDKVYELDGLQEGPVLLAEGVTSQNWPQHVFKQINTKIQEYSSEEIKFNLLVVKKSGLSDAKDRLNTIDNELVFLFQKAIAAGIQQNYVDESLSPEFKLTEFRPVIVNCPPEMILGHMGKLFEEKQNVLEELEEHKRVRKNRQEENARRKHNYLPFIFELFKIAGENGQLEQLWENANKK